MLPDPALQGLAYHWLHRKIECELALHWTVRQSIILRCAWRPCVFVRAYEPDSLIAARQDQKLATELLTG